MGACSKTVDFSHSRHNQNASFGRKLGAAEVELTAGELRDMNDALAKIEIAGDRYPAEYLKRTGK